MMMTDRVEASMAPSPTLEGVLDALQVSALGGDVRRLSLVCRHEAERYEGEAKERLLAASASLAWAAKFLTVMNGDQSEDVHAEC